jgi:hypothetical protein
MGVDYSAYVVVGVRIPFDEVYETKKVKAFPHDHPDDWEVDPKTGKRLWREESHFVLDEVCEDAYDWLNGRAKNKQKAVAVSGQNGDLESEHVYVGRLVRELDLSEGQAEDAGILGVDLLEEKKFLEKLLGPFWNEHEFGIWLVRNVTC